jgi:hypothetical protein
MAPGDRVLDRTVLRALDGEEHWHAFSTLHPAGAPIEAQALSCNPNSKGRLARRNVGLGMFYVGATEATAIWETVLQEASIDVDGCVTLHAHHLRHQAVVRLARDASEPPACLDLRPPHRYRVVDQNTALDALWMGWLTQLKPYDATHEAIENAARQFEAQSETMAGAIYPSRRTNETACVLHQPAGVPVPWTVAEPPIRLDSAAGDARIAACLAEHGFIWVGDPAADPDAQPDPDAL